MDFLKSELHLDNSSENRVRVSRDCIDKGIVRVEGEQWFDKRNYKCSCEVGGIKNINSIFVLMTYHYTV